MASPAVSVIVPAYNVAPFIRETLESVFAQTFTDYEVIVVNDGSPDTPQLKTLLEPYAERIRYVEQENRGLSGARNTGIMAAQGDYIALLDGDDIWLPEYLAEQVSFLRQNTEFHLVYCDAEFFGDSSFAGRRYMDCFPSEGEADFAAIVSRRCHVFGLVLARRDAMASVGGFDEGLRSCEDFDYWLRFAASGHRLGYQRKLLVKYRKHGGSLSANSIRMAEYNLCVLEKAAHLYPEGSRENQLVRRAHSSKTAELELLRGKAAMMAGNVDSAKTYFRRANEEYRSRKLSIVVAGLTMAPGIVRRFYEWRRANFREYRDGLGQQHIEK